ncbi:protein of unknown function [Alcaligenes faecalis subsp. faecalis]|nr:protein of unknown function [Alcaligenes faecalis subsp. faecalis]
MLVCCHLLFSASPTLRISSITLEILNENENKNKE